MGSTLSLSLCLSLSMALARSRTLVAGKRGRKLESLPLLGEEVVSGRR